MSEDDLRDCFAMFAMLRMGFDMNNGYNKGAEQCYLIADAMLEARKPKEEEGIVATKKRKYDQPLKKPALYRQDANGDIVPNKQKQSTLNKTSLIQRPKGMNAITFNLWKNYYYGIYNNFIIN